jgi:hypothetical protein
MLASVPAPHLYYPSYNASLARTIGPQRLVAVQSNASLCRMPRRHATARPPRPCRRACGIDSLTFGMRRDDATALA